MDEFYWGIRAGQRRSRIQLLNACRQVTEESLRTSPFRFLKQRRLDRQWKSYMDAYEYLASIQQ